MGMNEIKTVADLLKAKGLTPEEMELHRGLIDECLGREQQINESSEQARHQLARLVEGIEMVSRKAVMLEKAVQQLVDQLENVYLRTLPEDTFYRE
jgi:hypothetical protein